MRQEDFAVIFSGVQLQDNLTAVYVWTQDSSAVNAKLWRKVHLGSVKPHHANYRLFWRAL